MRITARCSATSCTRCRRRFPNSIGTSTLFAAWNAAIYVAQVEDHRVAEAAADGRYIEATRSVLRERGGLWFFDETYVISRRRA